MELGSDARDDGARRCAGEAGRADDATGEGGAHQSAVGSVEPDDYRRRTIAMALQGRTEFYSPGKSKGTSGQQASTNGRSETGSTAATNAKTNERSETAAGPLRLATTSLADIEPEPIHWLVPGILPLGKLVLLAGGGGHGKSTLTLALTADLTRGLSCLGLDYPPLPPDGSSIGL